MNDVDKGNFHKIKITILLLLKIEGIIYKASTQGVYSSL